MSATKSSNQTDTLNSINTQLAAIRRNLEKQNSFKLSFLRGLMTGLGATVGLAIILTLSVFIITSVANLVGQPDVGENIIEVIQ